MFACHNSCIIITGLNTSLIIFFEGQQLDIKYLFFKIEQLKTSVDRFHKAKIFLFA